MKLKRYGILGGVHAFSDQYMRWYGYTFQRNSIRGGYWHEDIPRGYYESSSSTEFFLN
jgi:hypothetical protein